MTDEHFQTVNAPLPALADIVSWNDTLKALVGMHGEDGILPDEFGTKHPTLLSHFLGDNLEIVPKWVKDKANVA